MRRQPLTGWRAGTSILGVAAVVGLLSILVITTVAWIVGTEHTALSALTGTLIVYVVLLLGILGISAVLAGDANLSMAGAAIVYIGQILLIVAALLALRGQEWMQGGRSQSGDRRSSSCRWPRSSATAGRHIVTAELPAEHGEGR